MTGMADHAAPADGPPSVSLREMAAVIAVVVGIPVLLLTGCVAVLAAGGDSGGDPAAYVTVACRDWVTTRLRAPATADYPDDRAVLDDAATDRWKVTGVVDSENVFGATVRSTWTCVATYDAREETTTLVSLEVSG